jgi:pyruvate/2-oxoglutarate dehydrogenase complex dihydrolipoamide dehydrogenase (E3) component
LGGSCINYGCTPFEAFLAAAHNAGRARVAKKLGVHAQVEVDFPAVMERVRGIRHQFNQGTKQRLERAGVQVVCAEASFADYHTIVSWEDYCRLKAILCGEQRTRSNRVLGYAVYTEPQVGRVGMTSEQGQQQGINACCVTLPMTHVARAIEWGHDLGFYRLVVDQDTDQILGATLVGYETAELVHVFLSLMEAKATWRLLEQSVHIHPTYGEALPSLARLLIGDDMPSCPKM